MKHFSLLTPICSAAIALLSLTTSAQSRAETDTQLVATSHISSSLISHNSVSALSSGDRAFSLEAMRLNSLSAMDLAELGRSQTQSIQSQVKNHLSENLSYSTLLQEQMLEGSLLIQLQLDTRGQLRAYQIKEGLSEEAEILTCAALESLNLIPQVYIGARYITLPVVFEMR